MNENRCKVLICSPMNIQGGITQWTKHIKEYYIIHKNNIVEIDFFAMDRSGYVSDELSFIKRAIWGLRDYICLSKKLLQKIKNDNRYNVIHIASSASISLIKDIYILKKLRNFGVKTIIHFHFGRIPQLFNLKNWEWKLICKVVSMATSVIVIDRASYDTLINAGFTNIYLLPNPLSPSVERLISANTDTKRTQNNILFAGHVIKTKGVYELIDACRDIPNIELKLVGKVLPEIELELVKRWENAKGQLVITNNIPFEEVIKEMLSCTLFVLPTYTEGFPNVILESMACGCPIITTPVGAIPEMLEIGSEKECGLFVETQTIAPLKTAILKLLKDTELANRLGNKARNRVIGEYSMENVWQQMCMIWNKTLSV